MKKHFIFAITMTLVMFALYVGTHPKQVAQAIIDTVPVPAIEASYQEPNQWAAELTENVETSASYQVQQGAMRTVLIDGEGIDTHCAKYLAHADGVAIPHKRLACVHPEIWDKQSLETYYVLAHELAHIALSEFGKAMGDDAHNHRDEHFVLTVHVMDELLKQRGVSWPVRYAATKAVSAKRGHCMQVAYC